MALNYLSSSYAVGNSVYGLSPSVTTELWGLPVIQGRYALILVKSGSTLYWKKLDLYSNSTDTLDMPFPPTTVNMDAADHTGQGQFFAIDNGKIFYIKSTTLHVFNATTGESLGSHQLRTTSGAVLVGSAISAISVKGNLLYVAAKSQNLLYHYNTAVWDWSGSAKNATRQVTVSELATYNVCGLFSQPGSDDDVVLLLKGAANTAIKFTGDLLTRKGDSVWSDPSLNTVAATFHGSILYTAQSDSTSAGAGVLIHRFADGSSSIIAREKSSILISKDRVKAGSGDKVQITYIARDGYGVVFPTTESVRFSLTRIGQSFDNNDGALALTSSGPFRDSSENPINVTLDVPFDVNGQAVVWWETPVTVPLEELLHKINIQFPIFS